MRPIRRRGVNTVTGWLSPHEQTRGPSRISNDRPRSTHRAQQVYPQSVSGTYRNIKWALMGFCLAVYYILPFVRWDRGPNAPNQAVLVDFPSRRFYFFFIELWPQEVYYFTGLLIIAAMTLFLMNAVGGRIWCGYLCPQTVWTDLFYAVERFIEGDRRERMKKAGRQAHHAPRRRDRRQAFDLALHRVVDRRRLGALLRRCAHPGEAARHLPGAGGRPISGSRILTFTTYTLAGHMREQVCVYMCPWPRIQAALTDEWALNVTYRYDRGEPRTSIKKADELRAQGLAGRRLHRLLSMRRGVPDRHRHPRRRPARLHHVRTVHRRLRHGDEEGRPADRLIAYDTDINIARRAEGKAPIYRIVRPRTLIYAGIIAVVGAHHALCAADPKLTSTSACGTTAIRCSSR